jgi:hypothetical protein
VQERPACKCVRACVCVWGRGGWGSCMCAHPSPSPSPSSLRGGMPHLLFQRGDLPGHGWVVHHLCLQAIHLILQLHHLFLVLLVLLLYSALTHGVWISIFVECTAIVQVAYRGVRGEWQTSWVRRRRSFCISKRVSAVYMYGYTVIQWNTPTPIPTLHKHHRYPSIHTPDHSWTTSMHHGSR